MAIRLIRRLAELLDVDTSGVADGDALVYDEATETWIPGAGGGGGGSDDQTAAEVPFTPAGNLASTDVQDALEELDSEKAATSHAHAGEDITSGTVADARIASTIARDSEVTAAISAHEAAGDPHPGYTTAAELSAFAQPLDSDLTAIAALTTTAFGRALLALADQAALLAAAGAAAASHAHSGADITSGTVAEARIHADIARDSEVTAAIAALSTVYQPLDSDLTAVAALTTTAFGRSFLALADAAAARALIDLEPGTDIPSLTTFNDHSARHENGGGDEITVAGLSGELADPQPTDAGHVDSGAASDGHVLTADGAGGAAWEASAGGGGGVPDFQYESRSSNTILGVADKGKTIDITAAITQTFEADETLGDGWWVILRNATDDGTVAVTLNPAGSETIDGLTTATMYAGEARLIMCNGAGGNFNSVLIQGGFAVFTADGNFVVPHGITKVTVDLIGGGGGGGGARGGNINTVRQNGGGGGGGGRVIEEFGAAALGNPGDAIAVDVGAGGAGGAGGSSADGTVGTAGSVSTFGSLLTAGGGGGGCFGSSGTTRMGGAGGGRGESGETGIANSGSRGGANSIAGASGKLGSGYGWAGAGCAGGEGVSAEYGGASGGGTSTTAAANGLLGGTSLAGGGGGGGGGGVTSANPGIERTGGAGGAAGTFILAGGGGGTAGTVPAGAGGNGAAGDLVICGAGGGGGGAENSGTGGDGGDGGVPAGGGGGGGGGTSVGGTGGDGARGECRVWYV